MLGLALLYVGFVLIVNGLWLLGKADTKGVIPINYFTGGLIIAGVLRTIFTASTAAEYLGAAQFLLFAFTYVWVGLSNSFNLPGRGLGWYCLLVVVTAIPSGIMALPDIGLFVLWMLWASLWFLFFLLLGIEMENITPPTGWWTIFTGIVTGLAGFYMLAGWWPW